MDNVILTSVAFGLRHPKSQQSSSYRQADPFLKACQNISKGVKALEKAWKASKGHEGSPQNYPASWLLNFPFLLKASKKAIEGLDEPLKALPKL